MKKYLTQIKIALALILAVFAVADLCLDTTSRAEVETVADAVAKAAGMDGQTPAKHRMIKRFYGLNANDYEGAVLYAPQDNMDACELFIVKLKDVSQQEEVEQAILERLDTQKKSFEGYGAEQTALLDRYILVVRGNYIFYIVGEHAKEAQKAFLRSL